MVGKRKDKHVLDGNSGVSLLHVMSYLKITCSHNHDTFFGIFDGSALVDTDHIIAIDCDTNALEQARENVNDMELNDRISFLHAKVPSRSTTNKSRNTRDHTHRNNTGNHRHKSNGRMAGRSRSNPQHQRKITSSAATKTTGEVDDLHHCDKSAAGDTSTTLDGISSSIENSSTRFPLHDKCVDTVMTNPPFGTKGDNAGIDIEFVLLACQLARRAVYSFHKTTTRDYVLRTLQTNVSNLHSVNVIAEMKFNISNTYQFHQQKSVDIAVDLIRVEMTHS